MEKRPRFLPILTGNARVCVFVEPLWSVPYNLYATYATLYMLQLGVSKVQVGAIATAGFALQIVMTLLSSYVTDRLGRKRTLFIFDTISWVVYLAVLACAQNVWWFLAATLINTLGRIVNTAWGCTVVEGTPPDTLTRVYAYLQVAGILAGFVAPAAGLLIAKFTLVPTMRGIYAVAAVSAMTMYLVRNALLRESEMGRRRMAETRGQSPLAVFKGYLPVVRAMARMPRLMVMMAVRSLNYMQNTLRTTYLAVLLTQSLAVPDAQVAWVQLITSAVTLAMLLLGVPLVSRRLPPQGAMIGGFACQIAACAILVMMPTGSWPLILLSVALHGVGAGMAGPFLESAAALSMPEADRATANAVMGVILLLFTLPSGYLGGVMATVDNRLPFIGIIGVLALCIALLLLLNARDRRAQRAGAGD